MKRTITGATVLLLAGLTLSDRLLAEEPTLPGVPSAMPLIDPEAMRSLERMGAYLRSLTAFSLTADDARDETLPSGQVIQRTKTVALQAHKPDRLYAGITTDRKVREMFYDGRQFTLLAPETGYYATVAAPPTIRELLTNIETEYGIEFPLLDLFRWGEDAAATAVIQEAITLGPGNIGGQLADHYAFRQADVDWQIWIAQGTAPLPLRYVIATREEDSGLQYMANLTWNTQAKPEAATFRFIPGKDFHPIAILTQDDQAQEDRPETP